MAVPPPPRNLNLLRASELPTITVVDLQVQVARQNMIIQALCQLLIAKGVMDESELLEWVEYVDKLDGKTDGQLKESKGPRACPKCRRMSQHHATTCQYCGTPMPVELLAKGPDER